MPGLELGTSRLSMLSECAHHLSYIPVDPSAHTHSISAPNLAGLPAWQWLLVEENILLYLIFYLINLKEDLIKSFFSKFFWKKAISINVSTLTFFLRASHLRCTQICFPFALLTQLRHVPQLSFRWQGTHFPHAFRFLRATELGFYWKLKNFYLSIVTVETTGHAIKVQKRRRREREAQSGPTWESGTARKRWAKSEKKR